MAGIAASCVAAGRRTAREATSPADVALLANSCYSDPPQGFGDRERKMEPWDAEEAANPREPREHGPNGR